RNRHGILPPREDRGRGRGGRRATAATRNFARRWFARLLRRDTRHLRWRPLRRFGSRRGYGRRRSLNLNRPYLSAKGGSKGPPFFVTNLIASIGPRRQNAHRDLEPQASAAWQGRQSKRR